jgi:TRAP transporter 4TM/12TM fusion protein
MRDLAGPLKLIVTLWLAAASAIHLYFGGFGFPEPITLRAFHLLVFVPPLFLLYPARPGRSPARRPSLVDWLWVIAAAVPHGWVMWHWAEVSDRMEYVDPFGWEMMVLAVLAIVTLLEATRRAVEVGLAWMIVISIGYMAFGHYIPGLLNSRPFSLAEILEASWLVPTAGGIYGPLTGIVATTIAVFIVFGAFMQGSGTGRLFTNLGAAAAGRYTGGPAKVAVITSGLFGTMSGSSVSNVITTGAMTIPLMIRIGYRPTVAAGIESAASVGGALMPPVMGAAAFVLAEITGIAYGEIVVAAAIGAALYYFAILAAVHFEAKKAGMAPMPLRDIPAWREVAQDAHLVIPVAVLVWMMMDRWSGNFAAFVATLAMVGVAALRRRSRMGWRQVLESLTNAGLTMAPLAVSIAGAGIVVSALTATGLVVALGGIIKDLAAGNFALLLILLAVTVLILGMGIPTTPSYIIAAAIGVPQILDLGSKALGVPAEDLLLPAHLFVFYFAVLADASPPVAAAAFAAAAIAKASPLVSSNHATRLGIAGFTVGFAFLYDPGIMLRGSLADILTATAIQVGALTAICAAYAGFLLAPMGWASRLLLGGAGLFAAFYHGVTDLVRLAVALGVPGLIAAVQLIRLPRAAAPRIPGE